MLPPSADAGIGGAATGTPGTSSGAAAETVMRRRRRALLVLAAVIAGAGIAYELSLMLLGTVTVGSTEQANAIVIGTAMLGMGLGAAFGGRWAAKPVSNFVRVEVALAVLGAAAAPGLYWSWARLDSLWGPLLIVALAIGVCIGAEMPLLAALNDRLARQDSATVVSNYTAADYFGALAGALLFGFVVRPRFGIVSGTIAVAAINLAAAAAVPLIVRGEGRRPTRWIVGGAGALVALALIAPAIVDDGRQAKFRDPIVATSESAVQELVVTSRTHPGGVVDTRLFLNGDLQLSSVDEHRYHESVVHPAVGAAAASGPIRRVLILGGGDCLAAREALRHPTVESVTMVELDRAVVDAMRSVPELAALQNGACDNERLDIVYADAFVWSRSPPTGTAPFDVIIVDFPDPDTPALGRLYSVEFYDSLADLLRPGGAIVVQCGSPFFGPEAYWTCATTMEAAGWNVLSYHADIASFGDWGFHLATRAPLADVRIPDVAGLRFLDQRVFDAATAFPLDVRRERFPVQVSTVLDPSIVEATQQAWIGYGR